MSGVSKAVGKIFKSVRKVAKKVWENKLLRTAIIVGAVAYGGYFLANGGLTAAPVAGDGLAMASGVTEGATFTTVAETANVAGTASSVDIGLTAGQAVEGVAVGSTDALALGGTDVLAGETVAAGAGTGAGGAVDLTLAGETASGGIVDSVVAGGKAVGGWMQENPMATMMLGQGVSGAVGSYEARKAEDRARAERESYGAMGYDRSGEYQGAQPGIVASQGGVATQAQKVRPIARSNLTQAYKQGLVRSQA